LSRPKRSRNEAVELYEEEEEFCMPLGIRSLLKFLYKHLSAGFEVPTATTVNSMTFLVAVPCTSEKSRRFGENVVSVFSVEK
jgi:hypothetical protein